MERGKGRSPSCSLRVCGAVCAARRTQGGSCSRWACVCACGCLRVSAAVAASGSVARSAPLGTARCLGLLAFLAFAAAAAAHWLAVSPRSCGALCREGTHGNQQCAHVGWWGLPGSAGWAARQTERHDNVCAAFAGGGAHQMLRAAGTRRRLSIPGWMQMPAAGAARRSCLPPSYAHSPAIMSPNNLNLPHQNYKMNLPRRDSGKSRRRAHRGRSGRLVTAKARATASRWDPAALQRTEFLSQQRCSAPSLTSKPPSPNLPEQQPKEPGSRLEQGNVSAEEWQSRLELFNNL